MCNNRIIGISTNNSELSQLRVRAKQINVVGRVSLVLTRYIKFTCNTVSRKNRDLHTIDIKTFVNYICLYIFQIKGHISDMSTYERNS